MKNILSEHNLDNIEDGEGEKTLETCWCFYLFKVFIK